MVDQRRWVAEGRRRILLRSNQTLCGFVVDDESEVAAVVAVDALYMLDAEMTRKAFADFRQFVMRVDVGFDACAGGACVAGTSGDLPVLFAVDDDAGFPFRLHGESPFGLFVSLFALREYGDGTDPDVIQFAVVEVYDFFEDVLLCFCFGITGNGAFDDAA